MTTITELSERYVDELARIDPVGAARGMGVGGDLHNLTDYSPDGLAAWAELLRRTAADLRAAEPADEAERLGRLFVLGEVEGELGVFESGEQERLVSALVGPPAAVRMSFDLLEMSTTEDWERIADRLDAVPATMAGYQASLARGAAAGRVAAKAVVEAVVDQCRTWAEGDGWFSAYVAEGSGDHPAAGADADDTIDAALDERLRTAARAAGAAYGALGAWLATDYLAQATDDAGVGEERYRTWARASLGGMVDLDDTYAWAWDELGRLEAEKAIECDRILPGAGFAEVQELLVNDPDRCIHGVDAYRQWLQDISDDATSRLNGWQFDIPEPLLRCEISIPPEGSAAAAYYTPPSEDLSQPGRTWFPALGRTMFPTWDEVTTAYHEAVPGHHLQLGSTRVAPLIRAHRVGFNSAHGEGWALYAERLMDELGFFDTPDTRLGFLASQAFRTVRVVVDIGLHTGRTIPAGWPHAGERWNQAIAEEYLRSAGGLTPAFAESEALRYLSWPGQAITYKVGERAWLDGREAARETAGPDFDLKAWHARSLDLGALGLDDLRVELSSG